MLNDSADRTDRVTRLLQEFHQLSAADASSADRLRRSQLLDEIQDVVGLRDRMVTERDIIQRAQSVLGGR